MAAADTTDPRIALVGGGPASLVAAIGLARRGIRTSVFERDAHPEIAPRFNPDRSYTIDISGHGLKALRHIDACRTSTTGCCSSKVSRFRAAGRRNGPCPAGPVLAATSFDPSPRWRTNGIEIGSPSLTSAGWMRWMLKLAC
ncbi:MAG TPA: NAD(P)-binding protein [Vicinamibacterales bacterium]|nr:NAD(P)-binding protein [Vicinamibacterales bacterium]